MATNSTLEEGVAELHKNINIIIKSQFDGKKEYVDESMSKIVTAPRHRNNVKSIGEISSNIIEISPSTSQSENLNVSMCEKLDTPKDINKTLETNTPVVGAPIFEIDTTNIENVKETLEVGAPIRYSESISENGNPFESGNKSVIESMILAVGTLNQQTDNSRSSESEESVVESTTSSSPTQQNENLTKTVDACSIVDRKIDDKFTEAAKFENSEIFVDIFHGQPKITLYEKSNLKLGWGNSPHGNNNFGLRNLGNTCYLNAILQALFSLPVFVRWLDSEEYDCDGEDEYVCIICMLKTLLNSSCDKTAYLSQIYSFILRMTHPTFIANRQEDAHELLLALLGLLKETLFSQTEILFEEKDEFSKRTNPINQMFGGYMETSVICTECFVESLTVEPFDDLSLEIGTENINTINDAVKEYFVSAVIDEFHCKCKIKSKDKVKILKGCMIRTYPHSLCIQLKRFHLNEKNNKKIEIFGEIDLTPYVIENEKPIKYKLVSIVNHVGLEMRSGHYTTSAFKENGSFYLFDDNYVKKIDFNKELLSDSYILFYELNENPVIENTVNNDATINISLSDISEVAPEGSHLGDDPVIHKADGKFGFDYVEESKKLLIEEMDWLKIFDQKSRKYKTQTYVTYFANRLNSQYKNVPCIIKSGGNYFTKTEYVVRLECSLQTCDRKYRLTTNINETEYPKQMTVSYVNVPFTHEEEHAITRHVRGQERQEYMDALIMQYPVEQKHSEIKKIRADPDKLELYRKNNGQGLKSDSTIRKIRQEGLARQDLDTDDITDLVLLKEQEEDKFRSGDKFACNIQYVNASPFAVFTFNRKQFDILAREKLERGELSGFSDATGGLVRKPKHITKKILFYLFSIPLTPEDEDDGEKNCRVFPFTQMVAGAHDQVNIGIWLKVVKREFCLVYPHLWPILTYAVTDFSLALIISICVDWNCLSFRDYLQVVYDNLPDVKKLKEKFTLIILCCSYLTHNFADDIDNNFVTDHARKFIKEIVAGMFNISKFDELKDYWRNFSIILRSKYYTNAVKDATTFLVSYLLDKEKKIEFVNEIGPNQNEEDDDEANGIDEESLKLKSKVLPDYKESPFYKDFSELELDKDKEFFKENDSNELNEFYSNGFADIMMRKYIPILPLWTCLVVNERKSNGRAEVSFKIFKKRMHDYARRLGNLPVKCGRFLKEMQEAIEEMIGEYELKVPRRRMCTPKRKTEILMDGDKILKQIRKDVTRRKIKSSNTRRTSFRDKLDTIDEEMEERGRDPELRLDDYVYSLPDDIRNDPDKLADCIAKYQEEEDNKKFSYSKKRGQLGKRTQKRRNDNISDTDSTPKRRKFNDIDLNDPDPHENWKGRMAKSSHTYFDLQYLKKCKKTGFHKSTTISQKPGKKPHKLNKFQNSLKDDPQVYMNLKYTFTVAYFNKYLVRRSDYITLSDTEWLSDGLIEYIFKTFECQSEEMNKSIQFEVSRSSLLCYPNTRKLKMPKIEKKVLIAALLHGSHYTLLIINTITKTFSYLDPLNLNPSLTVTHFENFKDFIIRHNAAYPQVTLPGAGWTIKNFTYPCQEDDFNCGVFIIYYAKEYFEKKCGSTISEEFCPKTFREYLRHYVLKSSAQMRNRCVVCGMLVHKTEFTKCDNPTCSRLTHLYCLEEQKTAQELSNKFFVCYICRE